MTFADDLARVRQRKDLVLSVVIDGIPIAFMERTVGTLHSSSTGRTQCVCLKSVVEGETVLNLRDRREEAPTLSLEMIDPDGTLADLFAVSKFRATYLDADMTASSTSVTVGEVGSLVAGDHVYIDDETITLGTRSVATFSSCTRGAFGSTAAQHEDDAAGVDGASIFTKPPSWVGRRAKLVGYTLKPDGTSVLSSDVLGTFVVDASPTHVGDRRWTLQLAGAMQDFMGRSVGIGLRQARQTGQVIFDPDYVYVEVDDANAFRDSTSLTTWVLVESADGGSCIRYVESIDFAPHAITFDTGPQWGTGLAGSPPYVLRPLAIIGGPSPLPLLMVLISDEGQLASTHDRLPGRKPSEANQLGWRLGAAIPPALVDTATIEALSGLPHTTFVIDDERPLGDVLREWCLLNDAIMVTTTDGLLSVRRLTEREGTPTSLGDDDVIPGEVSVSTEEDTITPIAVVRCGYSPQDKDFSSTITLVDTEMAKRYPRSVQRTEIELRSVMPSEAVAPRTVNGSVTVGANQRWVHPSTMPAGELLLLVTDVMRGASMGGPRRIVRLTTTMAHYDLRIGDTVTLDMTPEAYADAPDMRGGTLTGKSARVIARRPDYATGQIALTLELTERLVHVLPAAVIASASGAVMTLATTGDEVASATPENDFYVGARVDVIDRSGAAAESFTISSIASSPPRLTLSGTPSFAIQNGVDYVILIPTASGTTTSGYTNDEMVQVTYGGDVSDGDRFG